MPRGGWLALAVAFAGALAGCATDTPGATPETPVAPTACEAPCGVVIATGRLWEPMVAVDPTDPLHLVASSHEKGAGALGGTSWALSHVSFDGGLSWETHRLPGGPDAPPDHPLARATWMDDSVPVFLADGTLVWTVLAFTTAAASGAVGAQEGASLVALRSHDGGRTFPDIAIVAQGRGGDFAAIDPAGGLHRAFGAEHHDKQWVTLSDDGSLLMAWSQNLRARPDLCGANIACTLLRYATSTDGLAWSEPETLVRSTVSGAFPIALADGTWLVSYHETNAQEVVVARSTDQGSSWTDVRLGASTKFPVLARSATPLGERVHVAYPLGQDDRDGEQRVVARWSDDGGLTWSEPLLLDAPAAPGRTIPALAPAPDGGAFATFFSPRGGGAEHVALHIRGDGALSPRTVLSAHEGPTSVTGDYMGIAPLPAGGAFAVWTTSADDGLALRGARIG